MEPGLRRAVNLCHCERETTRIDKPQPRVAIVGGGLSGLTSAFRLRRAGCAVTLFERAPSLGLSRNEWRGSHGVVDVPLRMVGEGYYLALLNLCRDASVRTTRATVDCPSRLGVVPPSPFALQAREPPPIATYRSLERFTVRFGFTLVIRRELGRVFIIKTS